PRRNCSRLGSVSEGEPLLAPPGYDSQEDSQARGRLRTMANNCGKSTVTIELERTVEDICGR
ncbi:MAG TPA: hypothetical protein VMW65_05380, partial [Chloroflexota bacterium]|nr:hypothetical protein [Chloroflexota bacterium]